MLFIFIYGMYLSYIKFNVAMNIRADRKNYIKASMISIIAISIIFLIFTILWSLILKFVVDIVSGKNSIVVGESAYLLNTVTGIINNFSRSRRPPPRRAGRDRRLDHVSRSREPPRHAGERIAHAGSTGRPPSVGLQATRRRAESPSSGAAKRAAAARGNGEPDEAPPARSATARRRRACAPSGPSTANGSHGAAHGPARHDARRRPQADDALQAAGLRSEPPRSLPSASGTMPARARPRRRRSSRPPIAPGRTGCGWRRRPG